MPRSSICRLVRRKAPRVAASALLALSCACCTEAGPEPNQVRGPVRFFREHVTIEAYEGRTRVSGRYFFRNTSDDPVEIGMEYPFPVDMHHARPHQVAAWLVEENHHTPLGFRHGEDHVSWRLGFEPREELQVLVRYSQRISRRHAIYIVTTTSRWGEPLEHAEFEVHVPRELKGVEISFEPDRVEARGDTVVYYLSKSHFMPDRDMEIRWD